MGDLVRRRTVARRMKTLRSLWRNTAAYAAIIASGRYLKLCATTSAVAESIQDLKNRSPD